MQIAAQMDSKNMPQQQLLSTVFSKPENRYLLRQLCFVMKIRGLETYIVVPRDMSDYSLLAESIRPNRHPPIWM